MTTMISDTLEMSSRKRKIHVLHGLLEYALVITITLIAIVTCSMMLIDQTFTILSHTGASSSISILMP